MALAKKDAERRVRMSEKKKDELLHDHNNDGVNRRQAMQKVEGSVTFHTAASTAFPQPQPGKADSPGPLKVPAGQLRSVLGITDVNYVQGQHALAVVDSTLV
jgi:hypothetical protein